MHNYAEDGYDFPRFGNRIIVLRTFTAAGGSAYKIKDAQGHVVSSSRDELLRLLMYLNIQVDNPVCVLNQDASRTFLRESNPKKRFQLFLKATQFETIIEKLNDCHGPYKHSKLQLDYQRKVMDAQQKELQVVEEKFERLLSLDAVKVRIY